MVIAEKGKFRYKTNQLDHIYVYFLTRDEDSDGEGDASSESDTPKSDKDYKETEIGHIEVESDGSDNTWLKHIEVNAGYKRRGIATTLIELAKTHLDLTHIACVEEHGSYNVSLTDEGARLIAGCVRKGIVTPGMCIFSGQSGFIVNEGEEDPRLDSTIVQNAINRGPAKTAHAKTVPAKVAPAKATPNILDFFRPRRPAKAAAKAAIAATAAAAPTEAKATSTTNMTSAPANRIDSAPAAAIPSEAAPTTGTALPSTSRTDSAPPADLENPFRPW